MRLASFLFLSLFANILFAAPSREWFVLRLDDYPIGFIERSREVVGDEIRSREYFRARFNRNGVPLTVTTEEKHREHVNGRPLHFAFRQKLGESEMRMVGDVLASNKARVRIRYGRQIRNRTFDWPEGALMMEGVRLRERAMLHKPGSIVRYRAFNPSSFEAVETQARVIGSETITIGGRKISASRIEHLLSLGQGDVRITAYVDGDGHMLRTTLPLFGRELLIERSTEHVAHLPQPRRDIYDFTLVASPQPLDRMHRGGDMSYQIVFDRRIDDANLPTAEQDWRPTGKGRFDLLVRNSPATAPAGVAGAPGASALAATTWINADDVAIRRFAERTTVGMTSAPERMHKLEKAVSKRIAAKTLRVGYANASEAYKQREGDCTEHALLLAAAARSIGIPSRIAIGLVYAERFGRHERVFVPHAWTQAWIDGRWQSFDAAQAGFSSGHIALGVGDGDPSEYYGSLERIGAMKILAITPVLGKK